MLKLTPYDLRLLKALRIEAPEHVTVPDLSSRLEREVARRRVQHQAYADMAAWRAAQAAHEDEWGTASQAAYAAAKSDALEADVEHHRGVARQWRYAAAAALVIWAIFILGFLAVKGG